MADAGTVNAVAIRLHAQRPHPTHRRHQPSRPGSRSLLPGPNGMCPCPRYVNLHVRGT
jgi:hypothetical protein